MCHRYWTSRRYNIVCTCSACCSTHIEFGRVRVSNVDLSVIGIHVHDSNLYYYNKHTCIHVQDFELELAGAHVMRVQICSKSLLKEETYAHGKIRVCVLAVSPLFTAKLALFPRSPSLFSLFAHAKISCSIHTLSGLPLAPDPSLQLKAWIA